MDGINKTSDTPKSVALLQQVDDAVRRRAGELVRTARFAALATLAPDSGAPAVSRIGLTTEVTGAPVFLTSALTPHTNALSADPRCSILVGEPGKGDPLAHPRLSIFGRAERVEPGPDREQVRFRYLARRPKAELYADFGDFAFWRIRVERASFNGGFGKAYTLRSSDMIMPDNAVCRAMVEAQGDIVNHMNDDHADAVSLYATALCKAPSGRWRLVGIDPLGLDLVAGDDGIRYWFDHPITDAASIRAKLVSLARHARTVGQPPS